MNESIRFRSASTASRGKLFIVATPIGNLDDLTPRAREVLAAVDVIAAEDTRHTRGLLSRIGVEARLIAYHEHNERERVAELLERLASGATVALVSDAGTPLISDPGWRLVRAAREQGIASCRCPARARRSRRSAPPGCRRIVSYSKDSCRAATAARAERLGELRSERRTLVFYESVHRLPGRWPPWSSTSAPTARRCSHASSRRSTSRSAPSTLGELAASLGADVPLLGEFVLVVSGSTSVDSPDTARAQEIYATLAAELDPSKALQLTSTLTGISRNDLYKLLRTQRP